MITAEDVVKSGWLPGIPVTDPALLTALDYVNGFIATLKLIDPNEPHVKTAAIMLTARIHRRRNSSGGIETLGDLGGATYVARYDPDIARALKIDGYQGPQVG